MNTRQMLLRLRWLYGESCPGTKGFGGRNACSDWRDDRSFYQFGKITMPGKLVAESLRAAKTGMCPYIVEQIKVPQSEG